MSLTFAPDDVRDTFQGLLAELQAMVAILREDERVLLRRIMDSRRSSSLLSVSDMFPAFRRHSAEHASLRRLRDAQFIRPDGGGRWSRESSIAVKPFGALVWDKLGEERLFQIARIDVRD